MIVKIDKSFEKDKDKIKDRKLLNLIADCIENIHKAKKLNEINQLKKLQGYNSHYRIRIKDYPNPKFSLALIEMITYKRNSSWIFLEAG
jgi:hypothetical protein